MRQVCLSPFVVPSGQSDERSVFKLVKNVIGRDSAVFTRKHVTGPNIPMIHYGQPITFINWAIYWKSIYNSSKKSYMIRCNDTTKNHILEDDSLTEKFPKYKIKTTCY